MVIVKDIYLNFEDTELETLYIHLDEKGRAYRLIPPVDVSGLECRVEIVKPDNTFVIQDLETGEDGIILEIPEQAGAVVGVGWYNISFRDAETVIYTCYGRYQIDDHLISNSMVESIAEVNGYQFPDDFITQGDIDHVADEVKADIIKDSVYSDSTTWSSEKIANFIDDISTEQIDIIYRKIDQLTTYSTVERVVGKWIDGSDVYERTYTFNTAITLTAGVWVTLPSEVSISDLGIPVDCVAINDRQVISVYLDLVDTPMSVWSEKSSDLKALTIRYTKATATRTLSKGTTTD